MFLRIETPFATRFVACLLASILLPLVFTSPSSYFLTLTHVLLRQQQVRSYFISPLPLVFHYIFAELVHLYTWQVYWVCWGHKRLLVSWLQGCLRGDSFDHFLPEFDKPWVIHLRENLLLFYKPLHLEAQQLSTRIEVRRHHRSIENNFFLWYE